MDKKAIKTFAIQARRDLIKSIRLKMENLGITETGVEEKSAASTNEIEYYGDKMSFVNFIGLTLCLTGISLHVFFRAKDVTLGDVITTN